MKYLIIFSLILCSESFSQINNRVVDLTFSTPCKLIYTRTIEDINNYSCNYISSSTKQNFSVTINDNKNKISNFSEEEKNIFTKEYLKIQYDSSRQFNEEVKFIKIDKLGEGVLTYNKINFEGIDFYIKTILFLYNNYAYYFNITSNEYVTDDYLLNKISLY
ncbi:hypothetical protein [Empedobacter sp. UBA7494]|uniref:hypothetical protein n=1 Tax=Empedobacter sp. UBA7494 TaxID=1946450 RepID=UPI0025C0B032|nr:hypothetical protein [Empedobacter sp. UBA7494]